MDRKFLDVNAIAVFLDADHVGHPYVRDAVMPGFQGAFEILINAYQLLQARWILVSQWGLDPEEVDAAVESTASLRQVTYVEGGGPTVLEASASRGSPSVRLRLLRRCLGGQCRRHASRDNGCGDPRGL